MVVREHGPATEVNAVPRPEIRVLLVEDDEADAHRIEVMLRRAEDVQFEVRNAISLKAALTALDVLRSDVVLLDLSLEDYQGYDTVVEFTKHTDVPFVVLTGNDDLTMAMRCVNLGAQDYVLKNDVQAKPLERTLLMAIRRSSNARAHRELERASREVVMEDGEAATVSLLRPQVSQLIECIEDLESYVRRNAPGLLDDVRAILDKHQSDVTIKALRDTLRLHADRASERSRRISDQALKAVDSVIRKRSEVTARLSVPEAEADLLDIIARWEQP